MSAFSVFRNQKKRRRESQTPTVEAYYETRARRLSHIRYVCLLATILTVVFGFAAHGEELTAENFRYMLKFLDLAEEESPVELTTLRFDRAESNRGALYKGDVAVLNGDGLSVYSWQAGKLFSETFRMDDPHLVSTPQNLFAYDLGGSEVRMFNSYSQIARLSMEYPIYGFSACDSGAFAVISSDKNYRTAVFTYDAYARQTYKRLLSEIYTDQLALSDDGKEFLLLGHYARGGDLITVLQRYSLTEEEPLFTLRFVGELPLRVSYLSADTFAVLTGGGLRCYRMEREGEPTLLGTLPLDAGALADGGSLKGCSFFSDRVLLTFSLPDLSGGVSVRVYDANATLVSSVRCGGDILDRRLIGDTLYLLTASKLTTVSLSDNSTSEQTVAHDVTQLLQDSDGNLILFERSAAYRLSVSEQGADAP